MTATSDERLAAPAQEVPEIRSLFIVFLPRGNGPKGRDRPGRTTSAQGDRMPAEPFSRDERARRFRAARSARHLLGILRGGSRRALFHAILSAKDVETLPARPRHPSQVCYGGT